MLADVALVVCARSDIAFRFIRSKDSSMNKSLLHAVTATVAALAIAVFWSATVVSELFLSHGDIAAVKHAIAFIGVPILVTAMALTGASGAMLAKGRKGKLVESKKKRMPLIAMNGLLIMIPCALFLNLRAQAGVFDSAFYAVQALELAVGLAQLTMMGKNFRDGLKLAGKLRARPQAI
ncbi:hypothetical protein K5M36_23230 [Chromobacterium vaccinii]|nr:hypothetical protein [Chromobacterium vaccinii]